MSEQSTSSTDWQFDRGDTLVEKQDGPEILGIGGTDPDPREYTVKRRLRDEDGGKRFYYLEWTRETAGGPSTAHQLYDAGLVRIHYRSVEPGTDQQEDGR